MKVPTAVTTEDRKRLLCSQVLYEKRKIRQQRPFKNILVTPDGKIQFFAEKADDLIIEREGFAVLQRSHELGTGE